MKEQYRFLKDRSDVELRIIDMLGNLVQKQSFNSAQGLKTILVNTEDLVNGLYFITLSNGAETVTKKIMINR